ncbi:MAG: hypothetical protein WCI51_13440 [Lentisphaerota bacterium]
MNIKDLVLSLETCKRLKAEGFEFPESVFVWSVDATIGPLLWERQLHLAMSILEDNEAYATLTLHEAYVWILKLVQERKLHSGADYPKIFYVSDDEPGKCERICFSLGDGYPGLSSELNPLKGAEQYINNLLDYGKFKKCR